MNVNRNSQSNYYAAIQSHNNTQKVNTESASIGRERENDNDSDDRAGVKSAQTNNSASNIISASLRSTASKSISGVSTSDIMKLLLQNTQQNSLSLNKLLSSYTAGAVA